MEEAAVYGGQKMSKSEAVSRIVNNLLSELENRSRREDGIRDYFDIAIFGYHGDSVVSLIPAAGNGYFLSSGKLGAAVRNRMELKRERILPDGTTAISVLEQKVWIEVEAKDRTPMYAALVKAYAGAKSWCNNPAHRESYPPTVFNITDGEASDGTREELLDIAEKIKSLSTEDGNVLLVNIHISAGDSSKPVIFPSDESMIPAGKYAKLLYDMSSKLPESYLETMGASGDRACRAAGFNAGMTDLVNMMNIGTVSLNIID